MRTGGSDNTNTKGKFLGVPQEFRAEVGRGEWSGVESSRVEKSIG